MLKGKKGISLLIVFCFIIFNVPFFNIQNVMASDANAVALATTYNVWVPTNCEKVLQDQTPPVNGSKVLSLEAARNEYESGQVIINSGTATLGNLRVSVSDMVYGSTIIPSTAVTAYREHYMHVIEPSTENLKVGWYPDALIPLAGQNATFNIAQGKNQGILFTVKVPKGIPAGQYTGNVQITGTGISENIPVTLKVWDFELTDESHGQSSFAIWPNKLLKGHPGIQEGSAEQVSLFEKYYNFMLDYRMTPMDLPIDVKCNVMDPATYDLDTYVAKAKTILQDPRITAYRLPFFYNADKTPDLVKTKLMYDKLKAAGLTDKAFYYLGEIDEPSPDRYPLVKQRCNDIKTIDPNVRNFVTVNYTKELVGFVNTWCTILTPFSNLLPQDVKNIQSTGDHAFWYTCVFPKNPYPSYHIDDNMVGARVLSWMQKDYNIEGSIYWATDIFDKYDLATGSYIQRDVWSDPKAFPGANGDGFLLYPGTQLGIDGPVGTIRMEAIRDGAEDYEYLWTLEKRMNDTANTLGISQVFKAADALKVYYDRLFSNVNAYEADPAKLLQVRREVAEDIVNMSNNPKTLITLIQSADTQEQLTVYTESGAVVKVNGTAITGDAVGSTAQKVSTKLTCKLGLNTVNIDVIKDGITRHFTKVFKAIYMGSSLYPIKLNYCETQDEINKWVGRGVDLSLSTSNVTEGSHSMQAIYNTTDAFPGIRLTTDNGGLGMSDWTKCKKLEFDIYNDDTVTQNVNIKIFDKQYAAFNNPVISIAPKTSYHVSLPLSDIKGINLASVWILEVWMNKCSSPVTIYFDNVCLMSDQQNITQMTGCETQADIDKWVGRDVALSLSTNHVTEGTHSMQAIYNTTDGFPGVRLTTDNGGLSVSNWTDYTKLEFDIYNDDTATQNVNIKLFDKQYAAFDNPVISIAPKTSYHVSLPISDIKGINLASVWILEVWMNKCSSPVTLYFNNFYFLSNIKSVNKLNLCETQADIDKWVGRDVDLSLSSSNATEGSYSMQTIYNTTDDFPGIRLTTDNGGLAISDWTQCKSLEFDVYNDDTATQNINIKLFDKQYAAFNNPVISIEPKTTYHVSIPVDQMSGVNLSDMWILEVWMNKCSSSVTLYFDNFCLLSDHKLIAKGLDLNKAHGPITLDGNTNEPGWDLKNELKEKIGNPNNTAKFGTLWDNNNLYFAFDITDDKLINTGSSPWDDDAIEIFIDGDLAKGNYDDSTAQFIFRWNDSMFYRYRDAVEVQNGKDGIVYKMVQTATGYKMEVAIPWSTIGVIPAEDNVIGITAYVDDRDSVTGHVADILLFTPYPSVPDCVNSKSWVNFKLVNQPIALPVLENVAMTADKTVLMPAGTASLSVSGTMSDQSQADFSQVQIVYTSDNEQVAKVDGSGTVTAIGEGIANVKASVTLRGITKEDNMQIVVDSTPATTSWAVDKTEKNGWYNSDVMVMLSAADNLSGVEKTEYCLGNSVDWINYTGPILLTNASENLVKYRSIDKAGNIENTKQNTVKIDKTLPVFSMAVNGKVLNEGGSFQDYLPLTFKVSDDLSGVASASISIDGINYSINLQKRSNINIDLAGKVGSYMATITVEDIAGNRLEKNFSFTITTSINSMRQLIDRYVKAGKLGRSLEDQLSNSLNQAQHQLDKGKLTMAVKHMNDFIKHLNNKAQRNNVEANVKTILNADVEALIKMWSGK